MKACQSPAQLDRPAFRFQRLVSRSERHCVWNERKDEKLFRVIVMKKWRNERTETGRDRFFASETMEGNLLREAVGLRVRKTVKLFQEIPDSVAPFDTKVAVQPRHVPHRPFLVDRSAVNQAAFAQIAGDTSGIEHGRTSKVAGPFISQRR